jgi:hypothetical protein
MLLLELSHNLANPLPTQEYTTKLPEQVSRIELPIWSYIEYGAIPLLCYFIALTAIFVHWINEAPNMDILSLSYQDILSGVTTLQQSFSLVPQIFSENVFSAFPFHISLAYFHFR